MKTAFVAGRNYYVDASFLAAQSCPNRWDNMYPGKSRSLYFFTPAKRVTGGCIHHLEMLLHIRGLLTAPDGCVNHDLCSRENFGRNHHIGSENTTLVLHQPVCPSQYFFQYRSHVVFGVGFSRPDEVAVNPRLIISVENAAGGKQPKNTCVGCRHTEVVVAEGAHPCLYNGIFDSQPVTHSRIDK